MPPLFRLSPFTVVRQGRTILQTVQPLILPQGVTTAVIGPNGAGKSTLLKALLGRFPVAAELLGSPAAPQIKAGRVAWVAQNGRFGLPLTVREYAALGRPRGGLFAPAPPDHGLLDRLLGSFDLTHLAAKRIETLSGGEQQRAAIVRALMQQSPALLLDEPCNHLDIRHQHRLMGYLKERQAEFTAVMVLHDLNLAAAYAGYIILMDGGHIIAQGTPAEVMTETLLSEVYRWPVRRYEDGGNVFFRM